MIILSTMDSNGLITIKNTDQMRFGWNFSEKSNSIHWLIIIVPQIAIFSSIFRHIQIRFLNQMGWNGGSLHGGGFRNLHGWPENGLCSPMLARLFIINVKPFKGYHWGGCFNCYNMSTLDAMSTTPGRRRRAEWDSSETEHREVTPDRSDQQLVPKTPKSCIGFYSSSLNSLRSLYRFFKFRQVEASAARCWYGSIPINTIFRGMNIHLPAILMFTRGTRFWHTAMFVKFLSDFVRCLEAPNALPLWGGSLAWDGSSWGASIHR